MSLSLHCWQGDDVGGFETPGDELGGGLAATGNYPGKARNADELRGDLDQVYSLIPGSHRLSLHAMYAETNGRKVDRHELRPEHFTGCQADSDFAVNLGVRSTPTFFINGLAIVGAQPLDVFKQVIDKELAGEIP